MTHRNFQETPIWKSAFNRNRDDATPTEQHFFRDHYISVRENVAQLATYISGDMHDYTVHDISHLDALWDMASLIAEKRISINPPEAFVLGCSFLLHDCGMTLVAYPNGIEDLRDTVEWRDAVAWFKTTRKSNDIRQIDSNRPPLDVTKEVVPYVLRKLHPNRAELLSTQSWKTNKGPLYLIENSDLRSFYGPIIGQLAHSHCWSVREVENRLQQDWGALSNRTTNTIDCIKLACLIRIADILHLDSRRAPRLRRAIMRPTGESLIHWKFQERLARPHIENGSIVFSSGQPFGLEDSDAWWLAYEILKEVDVELRNVNALLLERRSISLNARDVKGIASPKTLSTMLRTEGWTPIDLSLTVSDVRNIVKSLGGKKLYGTDPTVALRELIQNSADAVEARRSLEGRPANWGSIHIALKTRDSNHWLTVEDNGTGMSRHVLSNTLLDFGNSLWRSSRLMHEHPGLVASGFHSRGRFGIGFFSVFMVASVIRVYTRRYDQDHDSGVCLEFCSETSTRPVLYPVPQTQIPIDGGTRVEICLVDDPNSGRGILYHNRHSGSVFSLSKVVGKIAPALNVTLVVTSEGHEESVLPGNDWLHLAPEHLIARLNLGTRRSEFKYSKQQLMAMRPIVGPNGSVYGRGFIYPTKDPLSHDRGFIAVSGLRANRIAHIEGILLGEVLTITRDHARPIVPIKVLARWATDQGRLIRNIYAEKNQEEYRLLEARVAEVILACGGDIGDLKIVKWGSRWLNCHQMDQKLRATNEVQIAVDDQLETVSEQGGPWIELIAESFHQSSNTCFIVFQLGSVIADLAFVWPDEKMLGKLVRGPTVKHLIRERISKVWQVEPEETTSRKIVGCFGDVPIELEVDIYRRRFDADRDP